MAASTCTAQCASAARAAVVKGAGLQRVERQHAPGPPVNAQRHAHAVVHRQGFAHQGVEQAVVGVGQGTVVVEAGDLAARQQGRQARVLVHGKTPPQRFAHQAIDHHRAQVFFFQPQQGHGAAAKVRAQAANQALQAHVGRQFGGQVGQPGGFKKGIHDPLMVSMTRKLKGKNNHDWCKPLIYFSAELLCKRVAVQRRRQMPTWPCFHHPWELSP